MLDRVSVHLSASKRPGWTLQVTFDLPEEGDMGYLVDIEAGRVVGVTGVD